MEGALKGASTGASTVVGAMAEVVASHAKAVISSGRHIVCSSLHFSLHFSDVRHLALIPHVVSILKILLAF